MYKTCGAKNVEEKGIEENEKNDSGVLNHYGKYDI